MSNVTKVPRKPHYKNEETGVVVRCSDDMEGTARKIAQDAPANVEHVVISKDVAGYSRHVNIAYEMDAHDAENYDIGELADTLESYGFEEIDISVPGAWGK